MKTIFKIIILLVFFNVYNTIQAQVTCDEPRGTFCSETYSWANISDPYPTQPITLNIKTDFGAVGNGIADDHSAFVKAAHFINTRAANNSGIANVNLYIPSGTYLVGKQTLDSCAYLLSPTEVLPLVSCKNVTVYGDAKSGGNFPSVIKHKDSLYFGTFNHDMTPYYHPGVLYPSFSTIAMIGNMISIRECSNITITNLELDGNDDNYHIGGPYGDTGNQLTDIGVWAWRSYNLNFTNIDIHNFGLDGMYVASQTTPTNPSGDHNVHLTSLAIKDCGRNCFSWGGGDDHTFTDCNFTQTYNRILTSAPNACIDLEAENCTINNHGTFINCVFSSENSGYTPFNNFVTEASNMTFTNCKIINYSPTSNVNTGSLAAYINPASKGWTFNKSEFYGSFQNEGGDGVNTMNFNSCKFSNCYNGHPTHTLVYLYVKNYGTAMFDTCTFENYNIGGLWNVGSCSDPNATTIIKNSVINSHATGGSYSVAGTIFGYNSNFNLGNYNNMVLCSLTVSGQRPVDIIYHTQPDSAINCMSNECVDSILITDPIVYPNNVYKAASKLTASNIIDLQSTSSVTSAYIKYIAGDEIDWEPGFEALMSPYSYFESYIKPCDEVTFFGRPINNVEKQPKEIVKTSKTILPVYIDNHLKLRCYPNPATNECTIELNSPKQNNISIQIADVSGSVLKTVYSKKDLYPGLNKLNIELTNLKAGTYFMKIKIAGEATTIIKFIKL